MIPGMIESGLYQTFEHDKSPRRCSRGSVDALFIQVGSDHQSLRCCPASITSLGAM